jgi:uroporphyrinogen decarboxylase
MTSKERVLAAVNHREPDRVAITFDAEKEVYAALHERLGTHSKEELFDRLNVDTWMIGPRSAENRPKVEKGGSMWGYRTKTTAYSGGTYDELVYSPLAGKHELSDIRNHAWPGPDALTFSHCPAEAAEIGRAHV